MKKTPKRNLPLLQKVDFRNFFHKSIFNFFTEEIAMDLGTANILILHRDQLVIESPSVIALDARTGKTIAIGETAKLMLGKNHHNMKIIRPLKDGVIADFEAAEKMIKGFVRAIPAFRRKLFPPAFRMVICIPSGITEVEMRAVKESAERINAKEIYLIHEPVAAAIGMGIDIMAPKGSMVVDIGGGTSDIAVISLGGIVCDKSIKIAGDILTADIIFHIRTCFNLYIGERTAEMIKILIGAAVSKLEKPPKSIKVQGRDLLSGKPREVRISYKEVAKAIDKSIQRIEDAVMEALSNTPPELAADIYSTGIYLAGGGALIRGFDIRLSQKTGLTVHIAEDPLRTVVRGTGMAMKDIQKYKHILIT